MNKSLVAYGKLIIYIDDRRLKLSCIYYRNNKDIYIDDSKANVIYGTCIELCNQSIANDLNVVADKLLQSSIDLLNNESHDNCIKIISKIINKNIDSHKEHKILFETAKFTNLPFVNAWGSFV